MADEVKAFPSISAKSWFILRKKFRSSIPSQLTPSLVGGWLDMQENSAKANIIPPLKQTGIIDKDGKPTDRARQWREDDQYKELCEEIRREVYPQELLDLAPDASTSRATVERWIARKTGTGERAAAKQAQFYLLLCEADPTKEGEVLESAPKPRTKNPPAPLQSPRKAEQKQVSTETVVEPVPEPIKRHHPSIHVDVHIHIPPEATLDQIDKIFESMGKHLKDTVIAR